MRQLQPQASIDDAQCDECNAPPDMCIRHRRAALLLLEGEMVNESRRRLDNQAGYDDDADLTVELIKLVRVYSHPDPHTEINDQEAVAQGHPAGVDPGAATDGTDYDGADGHEEGKSQGAEDGVGDADAVVEGSVGESEAGPCLQLGCRDLSLGRAMDRLTAQQEEKVPLHLGRNEMHRAIQK